MDINSPIESLAKEIKITPATFKEISKLGIKTISDLLFYFPYRYEDFSNIIPISQLQEDKPASIKGIIKEIKAVNGFKKFMGRTEAVISDDSGSVKVVWFNQAYLAKNFSKGDNIFLSGTPRFYKGLQLQNPIYEILPTSGSFETIHTARIIPIYKTGKKMPIRTFRALVFKVLQDYAQELHEYLPAEIIQGHNLIDIHEMVKNLHFPGNLIKLQKAKKRMAFEEIFYVQLAIQKHKQILQKQKAFAIPFNKYLIQKFISDLPFKITDSQKLAIWETLQDLEKENPMNRLIEGDVGSGKTLIAFTAALEILDKGLQAVFLCPTEILAQQHYKNALKYFENYTQISIILLTSKSASINGKAVSKQSVLEEITHNSRANKHAQFIISTHAVLEKNIKLNKLALAIIDEQHRFGVRQRAHLLRNAISKTKIAPHLLSMSATPIPRSLRLTLFGDLQISQIKQKPIGRKSIITQIVSGNSRNKIYEFMRQEIKKGRQAFVITPLIEEQTAEDQGSGENQDQINLIDIKQINKNAMEEQRNLQKIFPELKIGLLHGRMKSSEKEAVMSDFLQNKTQILVSTSVIEVGVDVPNASIMLIEGAEHFGLAQLHQFRGRVGRSQHQSYCFLFSSKTEEAKSILKDSGNQYKNLAKTKERLEFFANTSDGFALAEIDLKMRGFGNIFGEEQSGFYYFKYFSYSDKDLAQQAKQSAQQIITKDPQLKNYPELQSKIQDKIIHLE